MKSLQPFAQPVSRIPERATLPTGRAQAVGDPVALLVLLAVTIVSARLIDFHVFSDDQKTYIRIATDVLSMPVPWIPADSFGWILAGFYRLCGDWALTFTLVYGLFAGLYLFTAFACLRWLRFGSMPALAAALISLVPHYTLGMTSWGFAGAEFVTARIIILPIAALLMTVLLRHYDSDRVTWIFPAAAASSFLHLSSAFLFSILLVAYGLARAGDLRRAFTNALAPLLASAAIFAVLAHYVFFPPTPGGFDALLLQIYEKMAGVQGPRIDAMDPAATIDTLWQAAYTGFWWTMFPPRLGDVAYVLAENALVMGAVWLAWMQRARAAGQEAALARRLTHMAIAVVVTAYGFQTVNFLAWKLAGAPPRLFEEVRAFGFLYWPICVAIGGAFACLRNGAIKALLFAALLLSPTSAVRALPVAGKLFLRSAALRYGPSNLNREYLDKALGLHLASRQELERMAQSLGQTQQGEACRIIGLEHELKRSGCAVFISYQDKRSSRFGNPGRDALLVWYLSYEEIRSAIDSGDPEWIAKIAGRYGANLAVLPRPVRDPRFVPLFSGARWHAYRIGTGNGAAESARP